MPDDKMKLLDGEDLEAYKAMVKKFQDKYELDGEFAINIETGEVVEIKRKVYEAVDREAMEAKFAKVRADADARKAEIMARVGKMRADAEAQAAEAMKKVPDSKINDAISMVPRSGMPVMRMPGRKAN